MADDHQIRQIKNKFHLCIKWSIIGSNNEAAAVSESKNGMVAHTINKDPKGIYTHCFYHILNLSTCKTLKIQSVSNVIEQIKELSYFFNFSEPRQLLLLE